MKSYFNNLAPKHVSVCLSFAVKELRAQKVMAVLILIAVTLSGIMTTAFSSSLGILQAMRVEQASSLNGNRHVTFHQITRKQVEKLKEDSRLYDVEALINVGHSKLGNSGLTLYIREYTGNALNAYPLISRIKEGRLPKDPMEIALPENCLQYFEKEIHAGDTITLQAAIGFMDGSRPEYEYTAAFMVCGILESNYIGYSTGTLNAILGEGTASSLLPEDYLIYSTDLKIKDTTRFQTIIDELAGSLAIDEKYVQYNWILLDALGISYKEAGESDTGVGFSFMTITCVLIGGLVLLAAGLVIYNILKIAVAKHVKEYGILRAMGTERSRIYCIVSFQLLLLCGIGIPIGLLAGSLCAKSILTAATGVLNPDLFLAGSSAELNEAIRGTKVGSPVPCLVSAGITLLFAMLAAFPAARYASRVSPTVAMSGQNSKIKRSIRKTRPIHYFEAYYAALNMRRGRGRTLITILSLVMSITVFVALQSFTSILDTGSDVRDMNLGDYSITDEGVGLKPQSVEQIREKDSVAHLGTTKLSVYTRDEKGEFPLTLDFTLQSWEAFHIASVEEERLTSLAEGLTEEDMQDLLSGRACIVKNPIPFVYEGQTVEATNFQYNDRISVNGHKLRVAGITDRAVTINNEGYLNGVQMIVNDETYNLLTGTDRYGEIYPLLKAGADAGQFEDWLDDWCGENPGSHWLSYQQTNEQLEESFAQISMLCRGLILLIGLIGILNIINTVYSNIHTRVPEIGMQRAIGMSAKSLYKTFLWEGAYYGIIASIAGGLLGYICTVFVNAATTDTLQPVSVPCLSILEAAVISIAACLLATAIPLRTIAKMSIVESIEAAG